VDTSDAQYDTTRRQYAPTELEDFLSQFGIRMIQEAMTAAVPSTWERRADTLDSCRPKQGDFAGKATPVELETRDLKLAEQAEACRLHATFLRAYPDVLAETIAADVRTLQEERGLPSGNPF